VSSPSPQDVPAVAPDDASPGRQALLFDLLRELREVSTASVMFSQTVAGRLGLNPTDLETLGIIVDHSPVTAGDLAERTGLTTGAITGVVDRLERGGWVYRERDPQDRRRVYVMPNGVQADRLIRPLFASMGQTMAGLCAAYSDDDLALILDFVRRSNAATQTEIARLREHPPTQDPTPDS
jgi:DNA-binding MarR family transcriptional regulator